MPSFEKQMEDYQVTWRKTNVRFQQWGWQNDVSKPWILPEHLWEEGLWRGIRTGSDNSLPAYLDRTGVQKHKGVHNLKSSWVLCANLYFPFQATADGRAIFASFLNCYVDSEIDSLEEIELEYAEDDELHPAPLLGEKGGTRGANQTSPDLGLCVNGGRGLVLVENKFVEKSFDTCFGYDMRKNAKHKNRDRSRCERPTDVAQDPSKRCHVAQAYRRKYWDHLAPIVSTEALVRLPCCPAAKGGYQLFRQHALAEGIAQSGKYDLVVSAVAIDERNNILKDSLRSSGIREIQQWGTIFGGKAKFAAFTHQQWIGWVAEHDAGGQWGDWLGWVRDRYQL